MPTLAHFQIGANRQTCFPNVVDCPLSTSSKQQFHVGFLFNHDAAHQVAHIAPIIGALRENHPHVHVLALVSSMEQQHTVERIVRGMSKRAFACVRLKAPRFLERFFAVADSVAPLRRLYLLRKYSGLFNRLDCLVVPEMTSARLKTHWGNQLTALVLLPHGAGDREAGFRDEIKQYDYVLLSGSKVRDRMLASGLVEPERCQIVGYPKFDSVPCQARVSIFDNDRPTVLYNPHFEPRLSSWYSMGEDVLEFFADNTEYNLLVAPHVMLFKKRVHVSLSSGCVRFAKDIEKSFIGCRNIKFDKGSVNSINMHYVSNTDIYLGDVSSQVYEFIQTPRPCIFLNSHNADWREDANYRHWHLGPVLQSVRELGPVLANVDKVRSQYTDPQRCAFAETFDLSGTPSSQRAARAIVELLAARRCALDPLESQPPPGCDSSLAIRPRL